MWTAVTLAVLIAAGTLGYAAWAVHAIGNGARWWPFVLGYPFVYLAVPFAFTALWVLLASVLRGERPAEVALSWTQRLRLFWNEFMALAQSAPKMILYRWLMPEPVPAPAELPVMLVHGVGCNAGVWAGLRRFLEAQALGPIYAISYGPPLASIETFADQLAARIAGVLRATGAAQVLVVGHSMGGLVARAYLRKYGGASVRLLITIGTPHQGSRLAWMMTGPALAEMRPSSAFLSGLNGATDRAAGVRVISLWSWHDSMVAPQVSSRLDWAQNVVISGVAHNALLGDRAVWRRVAEEIRHARSGNGNAPERSAAGRGPPRHRMA